MSQQSDVQADIRQAAQRLAGMIPNGSLLAATDMTAFLTAVADRIDALTNRCGELMRGQEAQSETIAHLESRLYEATKAGTPYAADRDAMNALILENQRLQETVSRMPKFDESDRVWMAWALKIKASEQARPV